MTPKVSVIVPVYKAEAYLHRCVDSILAQTFQDFEVLLIDDGSPDRSGNICDEYAKKDSRVHVFHKENGGVSSARQCGIDNALGEYTIHADPDDWVEPNMLEELYAKAKEGDADMVICDFYEEHQKKQIYIRQQPSKLDNKTVFRELFQQLHGSCWNKLIKRVCYNNYCISFPKEMGLCEDLYVMFNMTMHPIKIAYIPKAYYHYDKFSNINSIARKPTSKDLNSYIYLISFLENKIKDKLYDKEIFSVKCYAKLLAFKLDMPYQYVINLYQEINSYLDLNFWYIIRTNKQLYISFVGLIVKGNSFSFRVLKILYTIYHTLRSFLYL